MASATLPVGAAPARRARARVCVPPSRTRRFVGAGARPSWWPPCRPRARQPCTCARPCVFRVPVPHGDASALAQAGAPDAPQPTSTCLLCALACPPRAQGDTSALAQAGAPDVSQCPQARARWLPPWHAGRRAGWPQHPSLLSLPQRTCALACPPHAQGDTSALAQAGASLTELDLTGNLLADWERFVPQLCASLPRLQVGAGHPLPSPPVKRKLAPRVHRAAAVVAACGGRAGTRATPGGPCSRCTALAVGPAAATASPRCRRWVADRQRHLPPLPPPRAVPSCPQVLNLSDNPHMALPAAGPAGALTQLRALVLNDCGLSWADVSRLVGSGSGQIHRTRGGRWCSITAGSPGPT